MAYIEKSLSSDEKIISKFKLHWLNFVSGYIGILAFGLVFISFISCSKDSNEKVEDCGCVKTTYKSGWSNNGGRYNNVTAVENVPCQDNEVYVSVSGNYNTSDNLVYYYICCDNINDPNSGCDDL